MIRNIKINGFASLAPMAGVADRAMRELCTEYGASFTVGEMTSAKGVFYGDKKSEVLLYIGDRERPAGCQLFGNDMEALAFAAKKAESYNPDFIDINMGCPAPKIAMNGGGSALMKSPRLAAELVKTVVNAVSVPVTVKMRAGWDESSKNAVELSKMCEHEGAAAITIHGRTRAQMYAPPVDLDIIKAVKNAVKIPVIANGDVISPADVKRMYKQTGCDHVSIGRGACGRPWIFSHINVFMKDGTILEEPSVEERMEILKKHIKLMLLYKGEHIAFREARKHAAWYIKGIKGAAAFRRDCAGISSLVDLENLCERVVDGM